MSGEKTISLDLSLFTDKGKGKSSSKVRTHNKTIRKEKKVKPKVGGQTVKNLRKNLLAKIKEHQKKESQENLSSSTSKTNEITKENNKKNEKNVKVINAEELFDDEFSKSLSYLSTLAKNREEKKKERKNKKLQLRSQTNQQSNLKPQVKTFLKPQLKPQLSNVSHKTIKQNYGKTPEISLDMPSELNQPKIDVDVLPSQTNIFKPGSSILGFKPNIKKANNTEINKPLTINTNNNINNVKPTTVLPLKEETNTIINIPKINNEPPYGVLKTGNKPTYREFNKTSKNYNVSNNLNNVKQTPIKIENGGKPKVQSVREHILNELKEKRQTDNNSNMINKPLVIPENKSKDKIKSKTVRKTITKRKFKLGKNARKRIISVLVKNNTTRRNIKHEVGELKRTPIKEIKNYLRKHGLLKVGSSAPNDVLRQIYEKSVLSGDIHNMSKDILLHNFYNDKESF